MSDGQLVRVVLELSYDLHSLPPVFARGSVQVIQEYYAINDPLSRHASATKAKGKKAAANPLARKTIQVAGTQHWTLGDTVQLAGCQQPHSLVARQHNQPKAALGVYEQDHHLHKVLQLAAPRWQLMLLMGQLVESWLLQYMLQHHTRQHVENASWQFVLTDFPCTACVLRCPFVGTPPCCRSSAPLA